VETDQSDTFTDLARYTTTVTQTFAWDFPFSLKHQNTRLVLLSGTGIGRFSGPLGAVSVAAELAKRLKPHRGHTAGARVAI